MVLGYSPPDLQMDAKDGADPFAFDGRLENASRKCVGCAGRLGFGARLAILATLQSVVLMNLRKSDIDAVTANASSTISLGPYFAGHHQPLRVWILRLYFMGLNLSNSQIAKELELDMEGFWSLLRSWLRPHRGISQEKLPLYLAFYQFVHNTRKRGKALLNSLVDRLLA